MELTDTKRNFEWLMKQVDRQIELQKTKSNHIDKHNHLAGLPVRQGGNRQSNQSSGTQHGAEDSGKGNKGSKDKKEGKGGASGTAWNPRSSPSAQQGRGDSGKGKGNGKKEGGKQKSKLSDEDQNIMDKRDANDKAVCIWRYTSEGCRRGGDCTFSHRIVLNSEEKKRISAMAQRRAKSRSVSRPRDGAEAEVCRIFASTGQCRFGASCRFAHKG